MTNREWLERLWADGQMPIRRAPQFDRLPQGAVTNPSADQAAGPAMTTPRVRW